MDKKVTGIICYLTLIGWIIAFCAGDKEGAKFHLNQALVLILASFIASALGYLPIPFIGIVSSLLSLVVGVFMIISFVFACKGEDKELPLISSIKILK